MLSSASIAIASSSSTRKRRFVAIVPDFDCLCLSHVVTNVAEHITITFKPALTIYCIIHPVASQFGRQAPAKHFCFLIATREPRGLFFGSPQQNIVQKCDSAGCINLIHVLHGTCTVPSTHLFILCRYVVVNGCLGIDATAEVGPRDIIACLDRHKVNIASAKLTPALATTSTPTTTEQQQQPPDNVDRLPRPCCSARQPRPLPRWSPPCCSPRRQVSRSQGTAAFNIATDNSKTP